MGENKNNTQIDKIKIQDILLKYPTTEEDISITPKGDESNSDKYKVISKNIDGFEFGSLLAPTDIGNFIVTSMKRQVSRQQLLDGTWWVDE